MNKVQLFCVAARRLSTAETVGVGSLPERFSWQPFQTPSHGSATTSFAVPYSRLSGSLSTTTLTGVTQEHASPYLCPTQSRSFQQPPYHPSSAVHIGIISPHGHTRTFNEGFLCTPRQSIISCCSQPYPTPICQSVNQVAGENDETTPLLIGISR